MKIKLTISRWHKNVERLVAQAAELNKKMLALGAGVQLTTLPAAGGLERLKQQSDSFEPMLVQWTQIVEAVANIKCALMLANAKLGITASLAQLEVANKRMGLLKALLETDRSTQVSLEALPDFFKENANLLSSAAGASRGRGMLYGESSSAVTLETITKEQEVKLSSGRAELSRQANQLSDSISDLNKEKVAIELGEEIVALLGLAPEA